MFPAALITNTASIAAKAPLPVFGISGLPAPKSDFVSA